MPKKTRITWTRRRDTKAVLKSSCAVVAQWRFLSIHVSVRILLYFQKEMMVQEDPIRFEKMMAW